ncbi:TIGR02677 family protein [Desulfosporosinus sp. SB140]|uniref:TIGR02677 family protein n=1 Tax=Desulfosporosinus paludis TaxID=3115649 RepID=UPI00388D7A77
MSKIPNLQALRNVSELKYVNADNVTRYRAIMRFLYQQYQRLNYWLKPEQVYHGLMTWDLLKNYTLEQCQIDLEQLVEWRNLTSRHDGGRAVTVEEYLRKKSQYLITPYSIEIERLLENLETVRGYGGSLEPTLFDTIAETLFTIREKSGVYASGEALDIWNTLYESFQKLHEASVDYIASLQTGMAEELMATDAFLLYKDSITQYLQDFIQALQRRSYKIEGSLNRITIRVRDIFLNAVVSDEWRIPKLEETVSKEQYYDELLDKWDGLCRWFIGENGSGSELMLLERASKDAIVKMVRSALRIQERKRSSISRRKELDYLGQWFYRIQELETAHKLAAYAFGLFLARHLQGEDTRESDSQEMSMWTEVPISRTLRSRSRKRNERQDTEAILDHTPKKEQLREAFMQQHKQELQFLIKMVAAEEISVSELGLVATVTRLQILDWIGRCNASATSSFQTPEGIEIHVRQPLNQQRTTLLSEDGKLELLNYKFIFAVINETAWNELLEWLDS